MTKIYFLYIKKTQRDTSLVFSKKRSKGERLNLRSGHVTAKSHTPCFETSSKDSYFYNIFYNIFQIGSKLSYFINDHYY